ncbi:MAG: glycosyltransferase [Candidatus Nanoarchaeia archaeon]|nr:glycosyltransferase [Candidatus Nanoarchaeia archaeon]
MKISVIIPAYNEEKNLPVLIDALRNQTEKDFEIIVVDNNSKDKTSEVAKKLADKTYECYEQGISATRNLGASKVQSEIIAFLDADSIPDKNWVKTIKDNFKDPKLSAISGLSIFENGFYITNSICYIAFFTMKISNLFGNCLIFGNNLAIKKEIFDKVGGFDKIMQEDFFLAKKLKKINAKVRNKNVMKVTLSARRMKKAGTLNVLFIWAKASFIKQHSYSYPLHDSI